MTCPWYTCAMRKMLQRWVRRLLDLPSPDELQQVIEFLFQKTTNEIQMELVDVQDRRAVLEAMESRVDSKLKTLNATEHRIAERFKELEQAEAEMKRVAYGISVTIYDLVEAVQIEHGALALNPEGKHILNFGKEEDIDKP